MISRFVVIRAIGSHRCWASCQSSFGFRRRDGIDASSNESPKAFVQVAATICGLLASAVLNAGRPLAEKRDRKPTTRNHSRPAESAGRRPSDKANSVAICSIASFAGCVRPSWMSRKLCSSILRVFACSSGSRASQNSVRKMDCSRSSETTVSRSRPVSAARWSSLSFAICVSLNFICISVLDSADVVIS